MAWMAGMGVERALPRLQCIKRRALLCFHIRFRWPQANQVRGRDGCLPLGPLFGYREIGGSRPPFVKRMTTCDVIKSVFRPPSATLLTHTFTACYMLTCPHILQMVACILTYTSFERHPRSFPESGVLASCRAHRVCDPDPVRE